MASRDISYLGALLAIFCLASLAGCSPAQIGGDDEVRKSVDALFTAVAAKDLRLLDQCEQELAALKAAGKLPGAASSSLTKVISLARGGDWDAAGKRLYKFIDGQRGKPSG